MPRPAVTRAMSKTAIRIPLESVCEATRPQAGIAMEMLIILYTPEWFHGSRNPKAAITPRKQS